MNLHLLVDAVVVAAMGSATSCCGLSFVHARGFSASQPGAEAAAFGADAAPFGVDAAAFGVDAAAFGVDAAAFGVDAAAFGADAAAFGADAAAFGADAATFGADAAAFGADAAAFGADAAAFGADAVAFGADAAAFGADAAAFGAVLEANNAAMDGVCDFFNLLEVRWSAELRLVFAGLASCLALSTVLLASDGDFPFLIFLTFGGSSSHFFSENLPPAPKQSFICGMLRPGAVGPAGDSQFLTRIQFLFFAARTLDGTASSIGHCPTSPQQL